MPSTNTTSAETQSQPLHALRLPSSAFSKILPHSHLAAHLLPPRPTSSTERPPRKALRPSGRTPTQFRTPSCNTNSLAHCAGSAITRLGDGTSVVCAIQAEILTLPSPAPEVSSAGERRRTDHEREQEDRRRLARLNLLVPNVDLATGADPENLPTTGSGAPSDEAQTLSSRIHSLLLRSNILTLDELRITHPGRQRRKSNEDDAMDVDTPASEDNASDDELSREPEAYWVLYISLLPLSISGRTSLFDALWASLIAALRTTRLPKAWWDADAESILCSPDPAEEWTLDVRGCPIASTFGVFVASKGRITTLEGGGEPAPDDESVKRLEDGQLAWVLADPEAGEDELCRETVTIVVDTGDGGEDKTKVVAVEKKGGGVLGWRDMGGLFDMATVRWQQWREIIP